MKILQEFASLIHYPQHWDTVVYPGPEDAIRETLACFNCSECTTAKQPEPEVHKKKIYSAIIGSVAHLNLEPEAPGSVDTVPKTVCSGPDYHQWNLLLGNVVDCASDYQVEAEQYLLDYIHSHIDAKLAEAREVGWVAGRRDQYGVALEQRTRAETAEAERDVEQRKNAKLEVKLALQQAQPPQAGQAVESALKQFNEGDESLATESAIERLRYFCSLAMNGRDWLDVEPFFDALTAPPASASATLEEKVIESAINRYCNWPTCLPTAEQSKLADEVMRSLAGETPPASAAPVDPIVELNVAMLRQRSAVGIAKYGTTLADNPLSHAQWLQHALEETLDQANYLQAAIQKLGAA